MNRFFLLTTEGAEGTEEEKKEMNNIDTNGFDMRASRFCRGEAFALKIYRIVDRIQARMLRPCGYVCTIGMLPLLLIVCEFYNFNKKV
ncbi:MAG: hypothetical protein EAZ98_02970 [Oscillatoriales cyanobacterium]|nr:MAG: hypothetical protein EA000_10520 [Oscillatoriales cyanobacterium]TAD96072.1 MAG: hypothetical protein EAZ96_26295 [Oscillatoriales cyanobacterium]TAE01653.1 MAG: hypothetical protein EAZ98_02970 [Oscillatoriales cyanobacterium]